MIADSGDPMQSSSPQSEQPGSGKTEPLQAHQTSSKIQHDKGESSSGHVSNKALISDTSTNLVSTKKDHGVINSILRPLVLSTITQSSRLLQIPLEIQEIICDFVFDGEDIIVNLRRGTQKFMLDWGHHLSILLSCRKINNIAMQRLRRRETTVDLRQYRRDTIANPACTIPFLRNLLSQNSNLMSVSTKLMLSLGQYTLAEELQELMPALSRVELYDFASTREDIRRELAASGRVFEYAAAQIVKTMAEADLSMLQERLPPNVAADLILVCDTLICIPENHSVPEDDSGSVPSSQSLKSKKSCIHTESWRCLLKMRCDWCKKEDEREEKEKEKKKETQREKEEKDKEKDKERERRGEKPCKRDSRYRTAKLRHAILFNESNPEGTYLSKDWVVAGLSRGPSFTFGEMLGIHCHDYCLELIDRGETVGI